MVLRRFGAGLVGNTSFSNRVCGVHSTGASTFFFVHRMLAPLLIFQEEQVVKVTVSRNLPIFFFFFVALLSSLGLGH